MRWMSCGGCLMVGMNIIYKPYQERFYKMDLNFVSIVYLFYRLAPFIIVCFFTLNSLINQDLRGLMYLCGLLLLVTAVFISSGTKVMLLLLGISLIITASLGLIKFLDIFKPFELIYKGLKAIFKNLVFGVSLTVLLALIIPSYILHVYEFSKIEKIDRAIGEKGMFFSFGSLMSNIMIFFGTLDDEYIGSTSPDGYCMEFSVNGSEIKKPLAATIYGFTYGYLMYYINKYDLINNNIPIVTLFPLLIIGDLFFQKMHNCRPSLITNTIALFLGISWGVNWGEIVASMKNASLQYFVGANQPVCSVPSSQNFVCNMYSNGQLISSYNQKNDGD